MLKRKAHVTQLRFLRDAEDLGQAVVELPEELRGLDGHAAQKVVEGLRVEERLQGQRLPDETVRFFRGGKRNRNRKQAHGPGPPQEGKLETDPMF